MCKPSKPSSPPELHLASTLHLGNIVAPQWWFPEAGSSPANLSSSWRLLVLTISAAAFCLCLMNTSPACLPGSLQLPLAATRPGRFLPHTGFRLVASLLFCQALWEKLEIEPRGGLLVAQGDGECGRPALCGRRLDALGTGRQGRGDNRKGDGGGLTSQ